MILIAALVKYPGVGYRTLDPSENLRLGKHHDALEEVREQVKEIATNLGLDWPIEYPSIPTLRKDLKTLQDYQILDRRMYRWGYYLGTGVMSPDELKIAFDALRSQAIYQGDPRIRQIYRQLQRRMQGFQLDSQTDFFYPVRGQLDRPVNYTDPEEMMERGKYHQTLYEKIDYLENAIVQGQVIEIARPVDPYQKKFTGLFPIYPLQLIYRDISWYLLYETYPDGCLAIGRLNRFAAHYRILPENHRTLEEQRHSLKNAHKLIRNGWGLNLGDLAHQKQELDAELPLISLKVRFFHPVSYFIKEGETRHPRQKLKNPRLDPRTKILESIDYHIELPPRSLEEFLWWLQRYLEHAQILSPSELAEKHQRSAQTLVDRYSSQKDNNHRKKSIAQET
jgi:hypothetical protein